MNLNSGSSSVSGELYIISTPIGNLDDMTIRAIETLKSCDIILAEDTRHTRILLQHFEINVKMAAYHAFNEHGKTQEVLDRVLAGAKVGLVTDAGTPAISDPGFMLVRECIRRGVEVECLPGATAFVPALVNSGLAADHFIFEGFLPHKKGRQTKINQIVDNEYTTILYGSRLLCLKRICCILKLTQKQKIDCR